MKIALFSTIVPDVLPVLFGERFLNTQGWEIDLFTNDHGLSGTFLHSSRPLYHYFAFPHLQGLKHYDLMVYIVNRDIDAHLLTDFMDRWPGIVILETMEVHRERFRFFREAGRFHRYLAEMALINGQRGLEIARILLREGEQHHLISQFSLLPAIAEGSLAIVVPDRRYWLKLRQRYPHKPVIHVLPARQASIEMLRKRQHACSKPGPARDIRNRGYLRCTILHETRASLWHETVLSTLGRLCRQTDLTVQIKTASVSRGHKRLPGKDFRSTLDLVDRIMDLIDDSDLLIDETLEASFLDDLFTAYAGNRGIPVIAPASNHAADDTGSGFLPVYPGHDQISQVDEWLEWLIDVDLSGLSIVAEATQTESVEGLADTDHHRLKGLFEGIAGMKRQEAGMLAKKQEPPLVTFIDPRFHERDTRIVDDVRAMVLKKFGDIAPGSEESTWLYSCLAQAIEHHAGPRT